MTVPRYWDLEEIQFCQHCEYDYKGPGEMQTPATYLFYYRHKNGGYIHRGIPCCDDHANLAMIAGCKLETISRSEAGVTQ